VAAAAIEDVDLSAAVRARDSVGPEDAAGVARIGEELLERLEGLR
jgi:hypothetical protein